MTRLLLALTLPAVVASAQNAAPAWKTIPANTRVNPPAWAPLERRLMDDMSRAAFEFVRHSTRSPDDPYESFYNYPLLYALGGDERLREFFFTEWNAMTFYCARFRGSERSAPASPSSRDGAGHSSFFLHSDPSRVLL